MRRLLLSILALSLGAQLWAGDGAGFNSGVDAKIMRDPRGAAQAGAMVAGSDGVASLEWNPAGLMAMREVQVDFSHLEWLDGVRMESFGLAVPLFGFGAYGFSMDYLYVSDLGRDDWGQPLGQLNIFNYNFKGAFGLQLGSDGAVAASYRLIRQGYEAAFSMGSAFDFGWRYSGFFDRHLILAMDMKNMGTDIATGSGFAPLPWTLASGLRLAFGGLGLEADYDFQLQGTFGQGYFAKTRLGAEYRFGGPNLGLDLRGGYLIGAENAQGDLAGLSAGLGLHWSGWDLDYTYAPQGDFGASQRAGLTYHFGER